MNTMKYPIQGLAATMLATAGVFLWDWNGQMQQRWQVQ